MEVSSEVTMAFFFQNVLPPLQPGLRPEHVAAALLDLSASHDHSIPDYLESAAYSVMTSTRDIRTLESAIEFQSNPACVGSSQARDAQTLPDMYFVRTAQQPSWNTIAVCGEYKADSASCSVQDVSRSFSPRIVGTSG